MANYGNCIVTKEPDNIDGLILMLRSAADQLERIKEETFATSASDFEIFKEKCAEEYLKTDFYKFGYKVRVWRNDVW